VRSTCIQETTDTQIATLKNIRMLFALNPESTLIRFQIKFTNALLFTAKATGQLEAIPGLELQLTQLYQAQKALDTIQQGLINKARLELQTRPIALVAQN